MKKTMFWPMCMVLIAFVVTVNSGPADAGTTGDETGLSGAPNPDPGNIIGAAGGRIIKIKPRNDTDDLRNLQWAVDNAAPGGTVELGAGTFFLGDGKVAPRRTVRMREGMRMVGTKEGDTWLTVIRGGGEVIAPTAKNAYTGQVSAIESGPIRVVIDNDDHPIIFEDIWFREWACTVVYLEACYGFEFRGCRISLRPRRPEHADQGQQDSVVGA